MKKIILFGSALLLAASMTKAQTAGWTSNGAFDDFGSSTDLTGMTWAADASFDITRAGDNKLVFSPAAAGSGTVGGNGTTAGNTYPNFSVTLDQMDLHSNADIVVDVENYSSVTLVMKIELQDVNGKKSDIEPNTSDVTPGLAWGDQVAGKYPRKANNGLVLLTGTRATFAIDLSSVDTIIGGLTRTGWVGTGGCNTDGPYCGPTTDYEIDPSQIVKVIFTVNYGSDPNYIMSMGETPPDPTGDYILTGSEAGPLDDAIVFHSFKIGTVATAVVDSKVESSLKVYPNPAKDQLNVSFDANSGAQVTLSEMNGHQVYTGSAAAGTSNLNVNTSGLNPGMYMLSISTENGKVARKVSIQ